MSNKNEFWSGIERSFADEDNRRFDIERDTRKAKRATRKLGWILGLVIILLSSALLYEVLSVQTKEGLTHYDRVQMQRLVDKVTQ